MPAGIWYTSRESVKAALDEAETARSNAQVDDAIEKGARDVDALCHREVDGFAPLLATRYFDYPSQTGRPPSYRMWFGQYSLLSASAVVAGGTTLTAAQYYLRPDHGPPYNRLEINLGGTGALSSGSTHQRAIAITGLWGVENTRKSIGSIVGTLAGTVGATASLSWTTARFGVGDVLFLDSEAVVIRDRTFVDSGQNLGTALDADDADTAVAVSDGTAFAVEEILLLGAERMRVVDIAGNTLTVKRAWDGSQLAAHTASPTTDIYALTGVELDRAQLGTTIAAHTGSTVYRWVPPGLPSALNRAYALDTLLQERSGYARVISAGQDAAVEVSGRGIAKLESDVLRTYGRGIRTRAIV